MHFWLIIAAAAVVGLLLLCGYVMKRPPARWDSYFVQHSASHPAIWQFIAQISDPRLMVLYAFITAGILCWQRRWYSAIWVLVTLGITDSIGIVLKKIVRRSRPAAVRAHYSFPSGHVVGMTVMTLFVLFFFKQWWIHLIVIILWLLIALSRLLLRAHYLSDILGAICLATCVFSLSMIVIMEW